MERTPQYHCTALYDMLVACCAYTSQQPYMIHRLTDLQTDCNRVQVEYMAVSVMFH